MHAASHKFAAPVIWHGYLISFIEAKYLKQWVDREGMLRLFFHDIWFIHMIVTWDGEVKILDALKSQFILYKLVKLNSQENNRHRFGNCSCLPCAGYILLFVVCSWFMFSYIFVPWYEFGFLYLVLVLPWHLPPVLSALSIIFQQLIRTPVSTLSWYFGVNKIKCNLGSNKYWRSHLWDP